MKENKYLYFGFLLIVGIVFYLMNLFTPLYSDDWHYNFIFGTQTQIKSISDILYSQYIHYFNNNGRFVPHFFVQLFDGILGKGCFNVANTIMLICFLYLLSYSLRKECKFFYISSSLALILIFFLLPGFSDSFLWMSGACNYLWVAVFLLLFNVLLEEEITKMYLYPILFIFGIICGWTNEALALGLGIGYFFFFLFNRRKLIISRIVLLLGYYIGLLMLIMAPGSMHRALEKGHISFGLSEIIHNMASALLLMDNIRLLPLLILMIVVFFIIDRKSIKSFIGDNIVLLVAIFSTFMFVLWTRHASGHSRFGFEAFSLLLLLKLVANIKWNRIILALCNLIVLGSSFFVLTLLYQNYEDYKKCIIQIDNTDNKIILTNTIKYEGFFTRYIVYFAGSETSEYYSPYPSFISEHFHKEKLCFIPESLYNDIKSDSNKYLNFNINSEYPFYVIALENEEVSKVIMKLYKTNISDLPFYIRPFANKLARYSANELEVNRYAVIKVDNMPYIIVNKHPMVDNRLKEIVVE